MRKICLAVIGLYLNLLHAQAQFYPVQKNTYATRPLQLDEVHLVSSYYAQDGHHSAVTGGIGTEKGTDFSNGLELTWVGYDLDSVKKTLKTSLGVDYHTSASQAFVSKSGASKDWGTRIYPQVQWSVDNLRKGRSLDIGAYYSGEYSYHSLGLDAGYSQKNNTGGEYSLKLTAYYDRVKLIYPSELRPATVSVVTSASSSAGGSSIPSNPRFTLDGSFNFAQIANQRMQGSIATDLVLQAGDLGLPFHRVYFKDGLEAVEQLPSVRLKLPIGFRLNYFAGDRIIIRSYYRFYIDSWGILANTASLEIPFKINPFFSIYPFYRYYTQNASRYFAPYGMHTEQDAYYTSNYALSGFQSQAFGAGLHLAFAKSLWGTGIHGLEARYSHYQQTTGLHADVISLDLTFK